MKRIALIISIFCFAGCNTVYYHPEKGREQFEADVYDCEREAERRVEWEEPMGGPGGTLEYDEEEREEDHLEDCMESRGWDTESEFNFWTAMFGTTYPEYGVR